MTILSTIHGCTNYVHFPPNVITPLYRPPATMYCVYHISLGTKMYVALTLGQTLLSSVNTQTNKVRLKLNTTSILTCLNLYYNQLLVSLLKVLKQHFLNKYLFSLKTMIFFIKTNYSSILEKCDASK